MDRLAHVAGALNGLTVAVVGAGWAGCAAAVEAARRGAHVVLLEAAAELGGRARRVALELAGTRHVLDNGQHLLLGAYSATAELFGELGIALDSTVERRPFELYGSDGFRLQAARLPAPWHLVSALATGRGLTAADRVSMIRWLRLQQRAQWRIGADRPAAAWLRDSAQSERVIERVWRPLLLAALNTSPERASAQIFANVLRDSLGASADASNLWLPRSDLSALLPDAVERALVLLGGEVRRNTRVDSIQGSGAGFELRLRDTERSEILVDRVIYAAPPAYLRDMARPHAAELAPVLELIDRFDYEPIVTVYLKYADEFRLSRPLLALREAPSHRHWGQWVFDRGALDRGNGGVLAVVISARGLHQQRTLDELCTDVARQLSTELAAPAPRAARAIVEKRATLAAVPGLQRPSGATALPGFMLAGDWIESDYPSTLETAVRNGRAAARSVSGPI